MIQIFGYIGKRCLAFEPWHSEMEMRRYNQYEFLVLPIVGYLKSHNVNFEFCIQVDNVLVESTSSVKIAGELIIKRKGKKESILLILYDLVFVTNGSITDSATYRDNDHLALSNKNWGSWTLWKNLANQSPEFGRPEKFYDHIQDNSWFVSAITTTNNKKAISYIEKISKREVLSGHTVTGGIITVADSNWQLSFTVNRQQQFKN